VLTLIFNAQNELMKTIIFYVLFASSLFLGACSKNFLEKIPESAVTTGNFYQTEDQFNQALIGAYAAVRTVKGSVAAWTLGELRADNTFYEYNANNRGLDYQHREDIDGFLDDNSNTYVSSFYNNGYIAIARANSILTAAASGPQIPEASLDRISGEAKFIRALIYFDLVRYYGKVPLYLQAVSSAEAAYLPRSSVDSVYEVIEKDLTEAIQQLPVTTFPQTGRATQGAAHMVLGDVYLTRQKYALAEEQLQLVTNAGYDLLAHYADVYALNNKNSVESIFELQYQQGNVGQESNFLYPFLPLSADVSLITGITSQNRQGGGWNVPTAAFLATYETNDERLDASVGIAEGTGPIGSMNIESVVSPIGYSTPADKRSYAFIKKYRHPHNLENNTDDDFPVYRFPEALLSLAEALNEQDRGSEGLPYLNRVRERAGLDPVSETNKEILRAIIYHERRVELAFENKRWLDLVRTGKALEVMNAEGVILKPQFDHLLDQSYQVTANRLVFAIPQREVLIGGLEQNPGYN
jgi:hypothetical protein